MQQHLSGGECSYSFIRKLSPPTNPPIHQSTNLPIQPIHQYTNLPTSHWMHSTVGGQLPVPRGLGVWLKPKSREKEVKFFRGKTAEPLAQHSSYHSAGKTDALASSDRWLLASTVRVQLINSTQKGGSKLRFFVAHHYTYIVTPAKCNKVNWKNTEKLGRKQTNSKREHRGENLCNKRLEEY